MAKFAKYNPFNNGDPLMGVDLLKAESEITTIRKVCKGSVSSILETLTFLKINEKNYKSPEEELIKESVHWKCGEQMMAKADLIKHESPVKEVLKLVSHLQTNLAHQDTQFAVTMYQNLRGQGPIQKMVEDKYATMVKEKEIYCNKQKVYDNLNHNYRKEKRRNQTNQINEDVNHLNRDKESKLKEEMDIAEREVHVANDKIAATLYSLQAEERDYADNIIKYVKIMQNHLENVLSEVKNKLPELENIIATTKKRRVFGEDLETHLKIKDVEVALPLKIAAEGLNKQLKETGLFRVGPTQQSKLRLIAAIDAGVNERSIHKYFDSNPHVYTTIIKSYLRELPQPILCSKMLPRWQQASLIADKEKRREAIREILASLPEAYKTNIGFLFKFLAKVVAEQEFNKMTIDNIIIVMGPNLVFDPVDPNHYSDVGSVKNVLITLIEDADCLFENMDHLFNFSNCIDNDLEDGQRYSNNRLSRSMMSLYDFLSEDNFGPDTSVKRSVSDKRNNTTKPEPKMSFYDFLNEMDDAAPDSSVKRSESDKRHLSSKPDVKKEHKAVLNSGGSTIERLSSKFDQLGGLKYATIQIIQTNEDDNNVTTVTSIL